MNSQVEIIIAATVRKEDTFASFLDACERSKLDVIYIDYPVQPPELQDGPFYAPLAPIQIVRITSTGLINDPFSL